LALIFRLIAPWMMDALDDGMVSDATMRECHCVTFAMGPGLNSERERERSMKVLVS